MQKLYLNKNFNYILILKFRLILMEYEEKLSFDVTFGLCLNWIQICELILSLDTHS